jgi:chromate transporter
VPFLYGGVVKEHGWLTDHQFLDAVAVALITPGPVVITTGFIGFLLAGLSGATVAATATFLPAYLLTIIPAPYFKKYGKRPAIAAFVDGVTAAAIGAISGAVIVLGRRSIVDVPTALLALTRSWVLHSFILLLACSSLVPSLFLAGSCSSPPPACSFCPGGGTSASLNRPCHAQLATLR